MVETDLNLLLERQPFINDLYAASTRQERCQALLGYYRKLWPLMRSTPVNQWAVEPNEIDWKRFMSPIEWAVWSDMREEGTVLYPQHPVAGYFVDFGHPVARVSIECDGEEFHQDRTKDLVRQAAIEARGWSVFRLSGSQCMRNPQEERDHPVRQLLRQISSEYGASIRPQPVRHEDFEA